VASSRKIKTHALDMGAPKRASKRMVRKELKVNDVDARETIDGVRSIGEDMHPHELEPEPPLSLGRFLMGSARSLPRSQQENSLLQGPGTLLPEEEDPFNASVSIMIKSDENIPFECSVTHGRRMLENLMEYQFEQHVCAGSNTSIVCHERVPFDVSRYMCSLNNVTISGEGTTALGCTKNAYDSFMPDAGVTEWNIFGKYTKLHGVNFDGKASQCTNSVRKALVQVAADVHNFYEWYGDWVTLWETLAALKWHPHDVDLYLVGKISEDGRKYVRPFDEAWVRMFKNRLHVGSMDEIFGSGTCFQQIVTVPQGSLSTVSFHGGRDGAVGCTSPLVMSSAMYLQSLFPLPNKTSDSDGKSHVTVLMRKQGIRAWQNNRMVIRDIEDVLPKNWTVSGYYPEDMQTFEEQLAIVGNTQVFVGIHGAGMMHVLFLPPRARVVEVFCGDRPRTNRHYRNLETLGEPNAGEHLFNYYFESDLGGRCSIDPKVMSKAIQAYDAEPSARTPQDKRDI